MAACSPTPTETLYATYSSYSIITVEVSSPIITTPSTVITSDSSSCLSSATGGAVSGNNLLAQPTTSPASSTQNPAASSANSVEQMSSIALKDAREGGDSYTASSSTGGGVNKEFDENQTSSTSIGAASTSWTTAGAQSARSSSTVTESTKMNDVPSRGEQAADETSSSAVQQASSTHSSAHGKRSAHRPRVRDWTEENSYSEDDNDDNYTDQSDDSDDADASASTCAKWTTITTASTSYGEPSTSWSSFMTTSSTLVVATSPTATLYQSCATVTTTSKSAAVVLTTASSSMSRGVGASSDASGSGASSDASGSGASSDASGSGASSSVTTVIYAQTDSGSSSSRGDTSSTASTSASSVALAEDNQSITTSTTLLSSTSASPPSTLSLSSTITSSTSHTAAAANDESSTNVSIVTSTSASSAADSASHSTSKGVQVGAAIGGILGVIAFIALVLFSVRAWKRHKRVQKTEMLRSSWFYGGDVAIPDAPDDEHEHEKSSRPTESRFSAPSVSTRQSNRFSRAAATFLSNPMTHLRQNSGRFPTLGTFTGNIRQSFMPRTRANLNYAGFGAGQGVSGAIGGAETAEGAGIGGWAGKFINPETVAAQYGGRPLTREMEPPRSILVSGPGSDHSHHGEVGWGQSYAEDVVFVGTNPDGGPRLTLTAPTNSEYSFADVPSPQIAHPYTQFSGHGPVQLPAVGGDYIDPSLFPLPPTTSQPASAARHLIPPIPPSGHFHFDSSHPHQSSIFEFASYDEGSRESLATSRSAYSDRTTRNWYDKPLWDREGAGTSVGGRSVEGVSSKGGASVYGGVEREEGGRARKSVKSVRWEDALVASEGEEPRAL